MSSSTQNPFFRDSSLDTESEKGVIMLSGTARKRHGRQLPLNYILVPNKFLCQIFDVFICNKLRLMRLMYPRMVQPDYYPDSQTGDFLLVAHGYNTIV